MTTQTEHLYIVRDDRILHGEPVVKGTRTPVRAIVENWRLGYTLEEIVVDHLPHLTLAAAYDAMSYYHDHSEAIEEYIELNRITDEDLLNKHLGG